MLANERNVDHPMTMFTDKKTVTYPLKMKETTKFRELDHAKV